MLWKITGNLKYQWQKFKLIVMTYIYIYIGPRMNVLLFFRARNRDAWIRMSSTNEGWALQLRPLIWHRKPVDWSDCRSRSCHCHQAQVSRIKASQKREAAKRRASPSPAAPYHNREWVHDFALVVIDKSIYRLVQPHHGAASWKASLRRTKKNDENKQQFVISHHVLS